MKNSRILLVALILLVGTTSAWASNFRGADLIYLNGVINFTSSSTFVSQVVIHNHSPIALDVDAAYLPTGSIDNSNFTLTTVATLDPGEQIVFDDFLGEAMGETGGDDFGHAIFFTCRAGLNGDCDCVETPGDCGPITVESRVYAFQGSAANGTTGQLFPGYPWYSYVSRDVADRDLDKIRILGVNETGVRGVSGFRSNIGYVNSSAYSSTVLQFTMTPDGGGAPQVTTRTLKPLEHGQPAVTALFPGFSGSGYIEIEQISVTPTDPSDEFCPDGCPGFYAYGSVADNITDDATTLEPIFLVEFDYETVYGSKPAQPARRGIRRPGQ